MLNDDPTNPETPDDEQPADCPICDIPIESTDRVGPVSITLHPCGHQIDEQIYQDLFGE